MYFFDSNLNGQIGLPESQHLVSCRIQVGNIIKLSNLKGQVLEVEITKITKTKDVFEYQILNQIQLPQPSPKIIFQAIIAKNYLEKLFEILPVIGVTKIYLFDSQYSPKQNFSLNRLQAILTRSLEQSQNPFLPEVIIVKKPEILDLLKKYKPTILHQTTSKNSIDQQISSSVLVGPEGGFSPQELEVFNNLGLTQTSLGDKVFPAWLAGYTYFSSIL